MPAPCSAPTRPFRARPHAEAANVPGAVLGGSPDDLASLIHDEAVNGEALAEPLATPSVGPAAFHAIGEWLRTAFSDLARTTEHDVVENDLVVTFETLSGHHTGEFVVWTPDAHRRTVVRSTSVCHPTVDCGSVPDADR